MNRKKWLVPVAGILAAVLLLGGIACCAVPYENLRANLFRLHILANSNDPADQSLKLAVRDDLLPLCKELLGSVEQIEGLTLAESAAKQAEQSLGLLQQAAQQAVYAHGSTQTAAVMISYDPFPQKQYDEITVPAGDYWCLRIVLGSGKGQNWWCVLYPPLCITPATAEESFDAAELQLLNHPEQYRFRLAILEWLRARRKKSN
jgi:stage II sporulation protein R